MKPLLTPRNYDRVQSVDALINPLGCMVTGIGPDAIGVLGDARSVGISVIVKCAPEVDVVEISTLIINRVKGITRVMMDIG